MFENCFRGWNPNIYKVASLLLKYRPLKRKDTLVVELRLL